MSQRVPAELDALRREVKLARRKADGRLIKSHENVQVDGSEASQPKRARLDPAPTDHPPVPDPPPVEEPFTPGHSEAEQEDLRVICEFFAYDDNCFGSDEEVWGALSKQVSFSISDPS